MPLSFWDALVFTFFVLVAGAGGALLRLRRRSTAHGSAGWSRPAKDLLFGACESLPAGSVFLGRQGRRRRVALPWTLAVQHGVIIGGSGTGKSRGYFLPSAAFSRDTSLICTDPKGELWRHTSGHHPEALRFAPVEPERSHGFNWIPLCKSARIAELSARAIVESGNTGRTEQAWLDLETAFLSALFSHAATLPEPTPLTAYRLFTRQEPERLLETLLSSRSEAAQEQAMIFAQTNERMRGSIVPVVAAKLQFMRDPAVACFTSGALRAPDLGRLRRAPCAVYWCLREQDISRLRPLTSVFFSLLLEQIAGEPEGGGETSLPILLLLDEFANVGVIPHFETTISLARGRGVALWLGIQSLSQLEARYGKANAQTILTNCATKIALHGLDYETARYFSETLGEGTVVTRKKARHKRVPFLPATSTTHTIAEHGRALLTPDEVRRIGVDQAITIVSNRRPMLLSKYFYDEPAHEAPATGMEREARGIALPAPASVGQRRLEPPPFPEDLPRRLVLSE